MTYEQDRLNSIRGGINGKVPWEVLSGAAFAEKLKKFSGGKSVPTPDLPVLLVGADGPPFSDVFITSEMLAGHVVFHAIHMLAEMSGYVYVPLIFCGYDDKHRQWMWNLTATGGDSGPSRFYCAVASKKEVKSADKPTKMHLPALMLARSYADQFRIQGELRSDKPRDVCNLCERVVV